MRFAVDIRFEYPSFSLFSRIGRIPLEEDKLLEWLQQGADSGSTAWLIINSRSMNIRGLLIIAFSLVLLAEGDTRYLWTCIRFLRN